jgi:hypothetical protein
MVTVSPTLNLCEGMGHPPSLEFAASRDDCGLPRRSSPLPGSRVGASLQASRPARANVGPGRMALGGDDGPQPGHELES